jgi:hypothetical protein
MTPPPNHPHSCSNCILQEARDGRVCPSARLQGLPDAEAERHGAALHAAILADAKEVLGFAELVRRDALSHHTGVLPASIRLGLLATPSPNPVPTDSPKEVVRVALPSRTRR